MGKYWNSLLTFLQVTIFILQDKRVSTFTSWYIVTPIISLANVTQHTLLIVSVYNKFKIKMFFVKDVPSKLRWTYKLLR